MLNFFRYDGHILASNLAKANIDATVIPEAAIDAIMGKVNKVIIGCHAGKIVQFMYCLSYLVYFFYE
jgi:translation initiation factor 2B subunit (eIF-2B alpha/beta/delta family)